MNKKLMWSIGLTSTLMWSAHARADETAEYEDLKRYKSCIETVKQANERLGTMMQTWFVDEQSSHHLGKNFAIVAAAHVTYFDRVQQFVSQSDGQIQTIEKAIKKTREIDDAQVALMSELRDVYEKENLFLISLPPLDMGLAEVGGEYLAAKGLCRESEQQMLDDSVLQITGLRRELGRMASYISEATHKRSKLFATAVLARKTRVARAYAQVAGRELREMQASIRAIFAAEALQRDMNLWWLRTNVVQGLARGSSSQFLQFTESLHYLRTDLGEVLAFEKKVSGLTGTSAAIKQVLKDQLKDFRGKLNKEIQRLEALGWQGVFAQQKDLSTRRRAILDRYVPSCSAAISAYEAVAAKVEDQAGFTSIEGLYKQQVVACVQRSNH